jgi:hypothetical protein
VPSLKGLAQHILINEIAYSNKQILKDFEDDSPDWFELYNPSDSPIDITDYMVIDDKAKDEYWIFPSYTMEPGELLLVFASGKDTMVNNEFHTSFKLGNMKETLFLLNNSGEIVDSIAPECVPAGNHSLSRIPDGSPDLFAAVSSPRNTNNNAMVISVNFIPDTLMISHKSGFYTQPISITLANNHPENTIVYTLDAEVPDEEAETYTGQLYLEDLTPEQNRFANIPETQIEPGNKIYKGNILRAVVYSNGCPASNEITSSFFINESMKGRYKVPVVSLITERDNLFDKKTGIYVHGKYRNFDQHGAKWERETHIEIFDSNGVQIIDQDGGMRIHGRGSRRSEQKSLRLYADAEYGREFFDYPLFRQKPEIERYKVILMRTTGGTRGPLLREELCNALVKDMNIDYNAGETAILFINGEYWGIYNLMERQNEEYIGVNYDVQDPQADIIAYDRDVVVEEGDIADYDNLISFIEASDPTDDGFYTEISKRIDIDAMIDYYIAEFYIANTDWPFSNVELWKLKSDTAKWRYFFFDSDASLMWINDDHLTEYNNSIPDYQRHPDFCTFILKSLLDNNEIRNLFFQRFHHHLSTTFRTDRVMNEISRLEKIYAPLVPEHIYRWHNPIDYKKWQINIASLRTFAMLRPGILYDQLTQNFGNPYVVFPNPGNGDFTLQFILNVPSANISIYSISGVLLKVFSFPALNTETLPIQTNLPSGLYLMKVVAGNFAFTEKLIIQ